MPEMRSELHRCPWATTPLLIAYHDQEWGVPIHDDRSLFEFLILEGMQAGLSWEIILKKRDSYRAAFDNFDEGAIAAYDERKIQALLANQRIIRNRLKIEAAIQNAKSVLAVKGEYGSFENFIWRFVDGRPKQNDRRTVKEIPAQTTDSIALSKELRRYGFKFVGPTICYAFMQAVGMVNDHLVYCFRHEAVKSVGLCPGPKELRCRFSIK